MNQGHGEASIPFLWVSKKCKSNTMICGGKITYPFSVHGKQKQNIWLVYSSSRTVSRSVDILSLFIYYEMVLSASSAA